MGQRATWLGGQTPDSAHEVAVVSRVLESSGPKGQKTGAIVGRFARPGNNLHSDRDRFGQPRRQIYPHGCADQRNLARSLLSRHGISLECACDFTPLREFQISSEAPEREVGKVCRRSPTYKIGRNQDSAARTAAVRGSIPETPLSPGGTGWTPAPELGVGFPDFDDFDDFDTFFDMDLQIPFPHEDAPNTA
jgi:hypothetical protein